MLKNKKGFTLIELLIVVAIIAILAAIAIPQFSAYRIKGYNAASTADLRNARTALESFFSDWQVYPSTAAGAVPGGGLVLTNSANNTGAIAQGGIAPAPTNAPSAAIPAPGFALGISQNVGVVVNTSANGGSFTAASKNQAGDRCFGADSDSTPIYWINGVIGTGMLAGADPTAVVSTIDFAAVVAAPCNGLAGGTGQVVWVAL
ncbi:MAG: prepilin-type N-terminal cleavage/methylation domain-containing protein [Nitrospirota bacterium]